MARHALSSTSPTIRVQLVCTQADLDAVDEFRFRVRINNRSAAIRELMEIGLRATQRTDRRTEELRLILECGQ
jgi:hypothetical protein